MNNQLILRILSFISFAYGQIWVDASPEILFYDNNFGQWKNNYNIMRPFIKHNDSNFFLGFQNENYFNNNAPNQENMSHKYFQKGTIKRIYESWPCN